jgi:hypothetical protein
MVAADSAKSSAICDPRTANGASDQSCGPLALNLGMLRKLEFAAIMDGLLPQAGDQQ